MHTDCIFCGIVAGTAPSFPIAEDETTLAFLDINPATPGHALVIPKTHATDLLEISTADLAACSATAQRIAGVMVDELGADGVNLLNCCGAPAWQTVFHFHLHVIPRYLDRDKDTMRVPWRPDVPGDRDQMARLAGQLSARLG